MKINIEGRAVTPSQIQQQKMRALNIFWFAALAASIFFSTALLSGAKTIPVAVFWSLTLVVFKFQYYINLREWMSLSSKHYEDMLALCAEHKEIAAYQQQVITQGREFIFVEYLAAYKFAISSKVRTDKNELYHRVA